MEINTMKFAKATGLTGSIFYLACTLVMTFLPKGILIRLANLLFHGIDFENLLRMDIPISETLIGIVVSFFFWGLLGYILVRVYNRLK